MSKNDNLSADLRLIENEIEEKPSQLDGLPAYSSAEYLCWYLGISQSTLKKLVRDNRIKSYEPQGVRCVRYRTIDVIRLMRPRH